MNMLTEKEIEVMNKVIDKVGEIVALTYIRPFFNGRIDEKMRKKLYQIKEYLEELETEKEKKIEEVVA